MVRAHALFNIFSVRAQVFEQDQTLAQASNASASKRVPITREEAEKTGVRKKILTERKLNIIQCV